MRIINRFYNFINENIKQSYEFVIDDIISRIDINKLHNYIEDNSYNDIDIHNVSIFFLKDEYQITVDSNGLVEFDKLNDDVINLIGANYVKLYHFTSSKFKRSIVKNGLVAGIKKTNTYRNSYSGIYLTTRTSGKEIDSYKYHIVNKYKSGIIMVTIKAKIDDLQQDMDDVDIASGDTQFVVDGIKPSMIVSIEDIYY